MYYYVIALLVFLVDRFTKWLVVTYMEIGQSIPLWEGVFHLTSHRNKGAAFGILQNQRAFFIIITLVVIVGIVWYLRKMVKESTLVSWALALILGGAAGNFYDRLLTGEVVDFFDFTLIHFPIFNVADSVIVIGVGLFMIDALRELLMNERGKTYE
ncbi:MULTISPECIES: signal peptidase II [Aneurinibacillus]|uniref:Lipoprotein signal peptidase n=1 Tax=Aneurinibacillus thermoaerophilus TaxID=143495 RepID=A0ABX8YGA6_ANETH|nr:MULTISPECIES: signal peptidase II [Aneurinibacillus]AMA74648.1 signal peptidase II [Aneurinibacillus sp. XH2]MED0674701.1 signal peptidase II [Aneurinibacillus thermoaerophilus]MED0680184.1 signal peptidase II [Aneurinibacillus thermoaerophilus]MED0736867.1 signal peptidase II [Aneurinibacillus thermoaerophilus]MED0756708.1 signal peptidase II [Aneurinibacillus thermoaerophilus]